MTLLDAGGSVIVELGPQYSQEVICNSMGIAIASKMLGLNYSQYKDFLETHGVANFAPVILDETVYESFSSDGSIIK